jgi:tetratricopeptide (TPR) repeat protein
LIDSYLSGNLPEEEQEAFEMHYFECDDCFALLKTAERLHSKDIPIVLEGRKTSTVRQWLWNWKPAAAFAALFIIVFVSIITVNRSSHKKFLYDVSEISAPAYMKSETRAGDTGVPGATNKVFEEAMGFYLRREYDRALHLLKQIEPPDVNPQVTFFKGICFLFTDDRDRAIEQFDRIIEAMEPSYYDEAFYYKAIALIRSDKVDQAREQLKHLAEMFSPLAPKAKELLEKLN